MRFFRLEKPNYFKIWGYAIVRSVVLAMLITVAIMMIAGFQFMIVSSGSMEPTLPVGSMVIVSPCDYDDLQLGDIVTMNAGGVNLTHRIVGKWGGEGADTRTIVYLPESSKFEGQDWYAKNTAHAQFVFDNEKFESSEYWVTEGDNSDTVDGRLTKEVVGVVQNGHAFTWVGNLVRYVRSNYIMIIITLVLIIVFVSVMEWLKNNLTPDDIEVYELEDDDEE